MLEWCPFTMMVDHKKKTKELRHEIVLASFLVRFAEYSVPVKKKKEPLIECIVKEAVQLSGADAAAASKMASFAQEIEAARQRVCEAAADEDIANKALRPEYRLPQGIVRAEGADKLHAAVAEYRIAIGTTWKELDDAHACFALMMQGALTEGAQGGVMMPDDWDSLSEAKKVGVHRSTAKSWLSSAVLADRCLGR